MRPPLSITRCVLWLLVTLLIGNAIPPAAVVAATSSVAQFPLSQNMVPQESPLADPPCDGVPTLLKRTYLPIVAQNSRGQQTLAQEGDSREASEGLQEQPQPTTLNQQLYLPLISSDEMGGVDNRLASKPEIAPISTNCVLTLAEDSTATVDLRRLTANFDDSAVTVNIKVAPGHGSATLTNLTLNYIPSANYSGPDRIEYTAKNAQNEQSGGVITIVVTPVNDAPTVSLAATPISGTLPLTVAFSANASDIDGDTLTFAWNFGDGNSGGNSNTLNHVYRQTGLFTPTVVVRDGQASASASGRITVLPPQIEPPPVDETVASTFFESTHFLYSGPNAVQTGVVSGTINLRRVAVLRGQVFDSAGKPLAAVAITIQDHPEFGQTQTRSDGAFDMAVNGGGILVLNYKKDGYLPVQRQEFAPWQNFGLLPDVVMTPLDSVANPVNLKSSEPFQVARGGVVDDSDGARQSTLLIPQGTVGEMVMSDGTTKTLPSAITIRATEYTVGNNGPEAMPGELPPQSGYTYALELSVDEAMAQDAVDVRFNQPLYHYVENFLDFPVGMAVPVGYYDRERAVWVPSDDGRIIKIIAITNSMAELDTDGDGAADNDPALGITDAERQKLAGLYAVGTTLWRVALTHFTPWDCNWPFGPPGDAIGPDGNDPNGDDKPDDPCTAGGSIIECESQVLGERIKVVGTPFTFNYRSDRARGRSNVLDISVSGATLPASLKRIDLQIEVAGKLYTQEFAPTPNQSFKFVWDGQDAYSRTLQGLQPVTVRVAYAYDGVYRTPGGGGRSFARPSGVAIEGSRTRQEVYLQTTRNEQIGGWDSVAQGLGGWSFDVHHIYDPVGQFLYLGDGSRRSVQSVSNVVSTVAGNGVAAFRGDGGVAVNAQLSNPRGVSIAPDGSLYISDWYNHRIRRIDPNGVITTVVGTGVSGYNGDEIPAIQAKIYEPDDTTVGPDGSLYLADAGNNRIRRITPDGIIHTVAGSGAVGYEGDGGPATAAKLRNPQDVTLAADGALYIADKENHVVRRVGLDGIISTVAGTGSAGFSGDNGPAINAQLSAPDGVAVGPDGSVYIVEDGNNRVRRIFPDGTIRTVAGNGSATSRGDGGLATLASLFHPSDIIVGQDGSMYIIEEGNRLRYVAPDGIISTVAGNEGSGYNGDGKAGPATQLNSPDGIALAPDGTMYIADIYNHRVRKLNPPFPGFSGDQLAIPSEDGSELYQFSASGRHLHTINTLTGATRYSFIYDDSGRLINIIDGDKNTTTIERSGSGVPTAIVGPYGQRTTLSVDPNGYLASITNPASESNQFQYTDDGLMTSMRNSRNAKSTFTYDTAGRLTRDENSVGGFQNLVRVTTKDVYTVTKTNALGHQTQFGVATLGTGAQQRTIIAPNGGTVKVVSNPNGSSVRTDARGVQTTVTLAPDPRWGMQAPIVASMTSKPTSGSVYYTLSMNRTVELSDPRNPLSLVTQRDEITTNGRTVTTLYTASSRTIRTTMPAGEVTQTTLDIQGRPLRIETSNMATIVYEYDSRGRLVKMVEGTAPNERVTSYTYNNQGYLASVTNAMGGVTSYTYDGAGRTKTETLPTGQVLQYSYDAAGNLISRTDEQGIVITYEYDAYNRQIAQILDPGGRAVRTEYTYDAANNRIKTTEDVGSGRLNLSTQYTFVPISSADEYYISRQTDPLGQSTLYTYSLAGDITAMSDPLGNTTKYQYSVQGWRTRVTTPRGYSTDTVYNNDGNITRVTEPRNVRYEYSYDSYGRLITEKRGTLSVTGGAALNITIGYEYDVNGRLVSITDGRNNKFTRSYDSLGNISSEGDPLGNTTTFVYDKLDRLVRKAVGSNVAGDAVVTAWSYDASSRRVAMRQDPDGLNLTTQYKYTRTGSTDTWNLQEMVDPRGNSIFFGYNSLGLLASAVDANAQSWTFAYDNLRRPTQQTDALGRLTTLTIDALGRTTQLTREGRSEQWSYNANGTQASYTNFAGQVTQYSYDQDKRLTAINYPAPMADVTYSYDNAANVTSMTDGLGRTDYSYDAINRMSKRIRSSKTVTYTYDANDSLTGIGYWGQGVVQYDYDAADRLTAWSPWGAAATTFTYRSSALLAGQSRANGVSTEYGYDTAGRLTAINHAQGVNALLKISYVLDANGNRTKMTDGDGQTNYTYDKLNRLTSVSYPAITGGPAAATNNFALDAVGNRTSDSATTFTYDASDRITNPGYSYDANGNLLSDGSATYEYDAANRLIKSTKAGVVTTYGYDGWGNLIRQTVNGVTSDLILDERAELPRVLGEIRSDGSEIHYSYDGAGLAAQRKVVSSTAEAAVYPLLDGLGSVRMLTDSSAGVTLHRRYDAFGKLRHSTGSGTSAFGYTGEWSNPIDGTVYLRTRHYLPTLGRFLQRDGFAGFPERPQSLNRYAYAENNPVNYTDPSGQVVDTIIDVGFIAYDLYRLITDNIINGCDNVGENLAALGLDVLGALIPGATGLGVAGRAASHADDIIDATRYADEAIDAVRHYGDDAVDAARRYGDDAADVGRHADDVPNSRPCPNSFSAETVVLTAEGERTISSIRVGDQVVAYQELTGSTGLFTVEATISHQDPVILLLTLEDETLQTTAEHPFYLVEADEWSPLMVKGRWVEAEDLQAGMQVRRANGSSGIVQSVEYVERWQTMYNLSVGDAQSFFVGEGQWLVHNCGNEPAMPDKYDRSKSGYERPNQPPEETCIYCGKDLDSTTARQTDSIEYDHLVGLKDAFERGGSNWSADEWRRFSNDLENLVQSCKSCNASKQAKQLFDEWIPPNVSPQVRQELEQRIQDIVQRYGLEP